METYVTNVFQEGIIDRGPMLYLEQHMNLDGKTSKAEATKYVETYNKEAEVYNKFKKDPDDHVHVFTSAEMNQRVKELTEGRSEEES
jgi:hypothetical protein